MKFGNSGKILSFTTPKRRTRARLPCFSLLHRAPSPTFLAWLALGMESTVPRSPSWRLWVGDNNPATSCHYLNREECRGWRTLASQIQATCLHKTKTKPTWTRVGRVVWLRELLPFSGPVSSSGRERGWISGPSRILCCHTYIVF